MKKRNRTALTGDLCKAHDTSVAALAATGYRAEARLPLAHRTTIYRLIKMHHDEDAKKCAESGNGTLPGFTDFFAPVNFSRVVR